MIELKVRIRNAEHFTQLVKMLDRVVGRSKTKQVTKEVKIKTKGNQFKKVVTVSQDLPGTRPWLLLESRIKRTVSHPKHSADSRFTLRILSDKFTDQQLEDLNKEIFLLELSVK